MTCLSEDSKSLDHPIIVATETVCGADSCECLQIGYPLEERKEHKHPEPKGIWIGDYENGGKRPVIELKVGGGKWSKRGTRKT